MSHAECVPGIQRACVCGMCVSVVVRASCVVYDYVECAVYMYMCGVRVCVMMCARVPLTNKIPVAPRGVFPP